MRTELIEAVEEYSESLLKTLPQKYCYHNLDHTRYVVQSVEEIGRASDISEKEIEKLIIAGWFHDLGYMEGSDNHEERSMGIASDFLSKLDVPHKKIEKIQSYIAATKMPQKPSNLEEMVMCDADLSHFANEDFFNKTEALREEICETKHKLGKKKWMKLTLGFMQSHEYFTPYAREKYGPAKQDNMLKIIKKLASLKDDKPDEEEEEIKHMDKKEAKREEKEKEKDGKKRPDRGIETMFRTTSSNHFQLSNMADNKANIMISVNTIIVSLIISILIRKLEEFPNLIIPTIMLTVVCLLATIFAILATRPNVTSGKFSKADIENKTANLLFFGNFHQMKLKDYEEGMKAMMNDSDFLYASMTRDIYYLGIVLGKKYKMLRISYNIFMFGFVASILAFGVAMYLFPPSAVK